MICQNCGYHQNDFGEDTFIGIFARGINLATTNNEECALYGCPNCKTVQFTTDQEEIRNLKNMYKNKIK